MKKITASFLTLVLLTVMMPETVAKQTGNWDAVKLLTNHEIAIKVKNGGVSFGLLRAADNVSIKVLLAEEKGISYKETQFSRDEIAQVWRAELRFDERQVMKGALIGAGVGAGIGAAVAANLPSDIDVDAGVTAGAIIVYGIVFGGAGAVIGAFRKKGHKKRTLIYSV